MGLIPGVRRRFPRKKWESALDSLPWKPHTEEPGGLQYTGLQRIEHNIMKGLTASIGGPEVPKRQRE